MRVIHRQADNVAHFVSFGLLALAFAGLRRDLLGVVIALPLAVLAVRGLRNGLYVDDRTVVVRNTFATHRIGRDDVERVDLSRAGRPPLPAIVIRRRSGKPIALWSVMPAGRGRRAQQVLVPVLAEVQRALGVSGQDS